MTNSFFDLPLGTLLIFGLCCLTLGIAVNQFMNIF